MRGVTITHTGRAKQGLAMDLNDVLSVLGSETRSSEWRVESVEAVGPNAAELHRIADAGGPVSGETLLNISAGIVQTIDGIFEAYRSRNELPWLRVRAVDGGAFDVESDDVAVLEKIRRAFNNVADLPT